MYDRNFIKCPLKYEKFFMDPAVIYKTKSKPVQLEFN